MEILGGPLFGVAGAGESHGPGITTLIFGCPPGLKIAREDVQFYLDRRRPGGNRHGTPRNEKDQILFTAGLFDDTDHEGMLTGPQISITSGDLSWETRSYRHGYTTGEPIAAIVFSTSSKSRHYVQFSGEQGEVRPGHTDLVKHHKSSSYVDYRGGGRSSYRSSITDVIGGSIARIFLKETFGTMILSSICQIGELKATRRLTDQFAGQNVPATDLEAVEREMGSNEIHSLDAEFAKAAGQLIKQTRIKGDSIGAKVEVIGINVPPLIGEPLYNSLKLRLMGSLGGLHAVRACEIGAGGDVVTRLGSQNNDPIRTDGYQGNNHGGMLGGITTGKPLVATVSFKPTSTITHQQQSVRKNLEEIDYQLKKGRHDPCVGVRAGVTLESRMAIEVMNAVLMHQAGRVDPRQFNLF
ncbi:MAG: chorismate synthase [Chloroflexota bacterium]